MRSQRVPLSTAAAPIHRSRNWFPPSSACQWLLDHHNPAQSQLRFDCDLHRSRRKQWHPHRWFGRPAFRRAGSRARTVMPATIGAATAVAVRRKGRPQVVHPRGEPPGRRHHCHRDTRANPQSRRRRAARAPIVTSGSACRGPRFHIVETDFLRRKRLIEIAETIVSMADILRLKTRRQRMLGEHIYLKGALAAGSSRKPASRLARV